jgi:hypothetical protein
MKEVEFANNSIFLSVIPFIAFTAAALFFYFERKVLFLEFMSGPKGKIFHSLHRSIKAGLSKGTHYNPHLILNKYFSGCQILDENQNVVLYQGAKEFWYNVYVKYPDEFISKLETEVEIKDINYFENLEYSRHPIFNNPTEREKANIYRQILGKGKEWSNTEGKREQATRLGYFAIMTGFVTVTDVSQKGWLLSWNKALELDELKYLTSKILIKNPLAEGERRTKESIKKSIDEIRKFFFSIDWQNGIGILKNLEE